MAAEHGRELKVGWSKARPFQVKQRGEPSMVPPHVGKAGVTVNHHAAGELFLR